MQRSLKELLKLLDVIIVILSEIQTGKRVLLPMVYVDYIIFDEEIEYEYPFSGGPGIASYPPR